MPTTIFLSDDIRPTREPAQVLCKADRALIDETISRVLSCESVFQVLTDLDRSFNGDRSLLRQYTDWVRAGVFTSNARSTSTHPRAGRPNQFTPEYCNLLAKFRLELGSNRMRWGMFMRTVPQHHPRKNDRNHWVNIYHRNKRAIEARAHEMELERARIPVITAVLARIPLGHSTYTALLSLDGHGGLTGQEWLEYYVNNARFGTFTSQSAAAVVLASEEAGAAREDFQMLCHFVWRSPTKALQWSSMLDKLYPNHPHKEDLMYWQQLYKDRKSDVHKRVRRLCEEDARVSQVFSGQSTDIRALQMRSVQTLEVQEAVIRLKVESAE